MVTTISIPQGAKHPEAAFEFLEFTTSEKSAYKAANDMQALCTEELHKQFPELV